MQESKLWFESYGPNPTNLLCPSVLLDLMSMEPYTYHRLSNPSTGETTLRRGAFTSKCVYIHKCEGGILKVKKNDTKLWTNPCKNKNKLCGAAYWDCVTLELNFTPRGLSSVKQMRWNWWTVGLGHGGRSKPDKKGYDRQRGEWKEGGMMV